jgi:hypothetical protein
MADAMNEELLAGGTLTREKCREILTFGFGPVPTNFVVLTKPSFGGSNTITDDISAMSEGLEYLSEVAEPFKQDAATAALINTGRDKEGEGKLMDQAPSASPLREPDKSVHTPESQKRKRKLAALSS